MRRIHFSLLVALPMTGALAVACSSGPSRGSAHRQDVVLRRDADTVEARVPRDATLETLLRQQRIPGDLAMSMVGAVRHVFNPQNLRADQPYRVTRTLDGLLREFRYDIDADRVLRVIFHPNATGPATVDAHIEAAPKEVATDGAVVEISREHTSLSSAFDAAGENIQLALAVAEVFGGEVDFNSDLQRGDRLEVSFERVIRDGQFAGYGDVLGATLHNQGRTLTAIRYPGPDGKPAWYDEHGRSLKRQFLRSPLPFDPRITSGFTTSRLHPIYGDYRAHLGVDYAAPYGTAVIAVSAGIVLVAEMAGDAGRMVQLRHAGGYETAYLHLSAFAPGIHPGVRVEQGQVIGRVGQSGAATGPHLDFRFKKDGVYVNPVLEARKLPPGEPIAKDTFDAFARQRDRVFAGLRTHLAGLAAHPRPLPHSSHH